MTSAILDCLYGDTEFPPEMVRLASAPIVQRLRHVRLSNIDSLAMPGIGGTSRYEHVLGVAYLASQLGFANRLSRRDRLCLTAAALLHDWAITAFGHLVEEGLAYAGINFHHESKLEELSSGSESSTEIGGVNRQIICGRQSGLGNWIDSVTDSGDRSRFLGDLVSTIQGEGKFGKIVAGEIDIDNIDNVCRVAYHIGLPFAKDLPLSLARSVVGISESGSPIFRANAEILVHEWLELRSAVYQRLMPAQPDFAAKAMLLYCTMVACKEGEILAQDWNLTDFDFISRLKNSRHEECRITLERWQVGEFWNTSNLVWLAGGRPSYLELARFSTHLEQALGRQCFAYGIKDKRVRECRVQWDDGRDTVIGRKPCAWLLGVASSARRSFSQSDQRRLVSEAEAFFSSQLISDDGPQAPSDQLSLL